VRTCPPKIARNISDVGAGVRRSARTRALAGYARSAGPRGPAARRAACRFTPVRRGAWASRDFRLLLVGRGLSSVGDSVVSVALPFAVLDLTGSVKDLGLVLAARMLPLALFVLVGGVWADRLSRRVVMLTSDAVRCAAQVGSAALVLASTTHIWQLAALQFLYGTGTAFFMPAAVAVVPQTVAGKDIQHANSLLSVAENVSSVGGPALAGAVVVAIGAGWGLMVDAASFAASVALLAPMHLKPIGVPPRRSVVAELRAGWRSFASRTWLAASVPSFMVVNALGFSPLLVLGPVIAKDSLGGASAWAIILVAMGAGSLLGGVIGSRWAPRYPLRATLSFALIGAPALLTLLAVAAPVPLLALAALATGTATALFNLTWFTVLHRRIPADELSRVSSWDSLGSFVATPLGLALTGPIAIALGVEETLYLAAAVFVLATAANLAFPSVRNLDDGAEPERA